MEAEATAEVGAEVTAEVEAATVVAVTTAVVVEGAATTAGTTEQPHSGRENIMRPGIFSQSWLPQGMSVPTDATTVKVVTGPPPGYAGGQPSAMAGLGAVSPFRAWIAAARSRAALRGFGCPGRIGGC